ncbi:MAG: monovalent cation/H(+) antiporter subunit G [Pseudomonadota bacterium]
MIDLIALAIMFLGVAFLILASVGLIRFDDPLQRMHAATKAGTLGAGLVLIGTMVSKGTGDVTLTGGLTLVFLLLTVPVAGHLLARAAYMSGAQLVGVGKDDPLNGVLARLDVPLETASQQLAFEPTSSQTVASHVGAQAVAVEHVPSPERVRFAAIGNTAPTLGRRAAGFAARTALPLTAVVAVDTSYADATENSAETMRQMRDTVSHWLPDLRSLSDELGVPIDLVYEEGDAAAAMAGVGDVREFLILPIDGWADHGVGEAAGPSATGSSAKDPDGLLRVCDLHPGPVLYAVESQQMGPVAILFDGSPEVWRGLDFALREGLWTISDLRVFGSIDAAARELIETKASNAGVPVRFLDADLPVEDGTLFPHEVADGVVAVILPDLPSPKHIRWNGLFWQDRIARNWQGDVLVWT